MEQQSDNQQLIVRYLLNDLPEQEQSQFEDAYFADYDLFQQMEAVEEDLIEDYARDRLTATERVQFECHYLATPERREKIAFAEALVAAVSERQKPAPNFLPSSWRSWFLPKPAIGWAFASLLLIACTWLFVETQRLRNQINQIQVQTAERDRQQRQLAQDLQQQIATVRERNDQLTKELAGAQNQLAQLRATTPKPVQSSSLLATITFGPPTLSAMPTQDLIIRPGVSSVQLIHQLRRNVFKSYRAVVRTDPDGKTVLDQPGLKLRPLPGGKKAVVVSLPASKFTISQDYTLTISGKTSARGYEEISVRHFRVDRQ